jgi:hypothetical protein
VAKVVAQAGKVLLGLLNLACCAARHLQALPVSLAPWRWVKNNSMEVGCKLIETLTVDVVKKS